MTMYDTMRAWIERGKRAFRPAYFLLLSAAIFVFYLTILHPWLMQWGATAAEQQMALPGDEYAAPGAIRVTRAVTIAAPPAKVWPWLLQIGQDRAGFYSYTWLENLAFARMPDVQAIRPEWQQRQIGDRAPMARQDVFGGSMSDATTLPVKILDPSRAIGTVPCVFVLQPVDAQITRLLCREYDAYSLPVRWLLWDPMHFTMERRMMLGIKALAEGHTLPAPVLGFAAQIGWAGAALGVFGLFLVRRRHWPWLVLPAAPAVPVLWTTGDGNAALAGFLAVGIPVVGALIYGRRWWAPFSTIAALVLLLLVVPPEAYAVFGLIFDLMLLLALSSALGVWSRRRAAPGKPGLAHGAA